MSQEDKLRGTEVMPTPHHKVYPLTVHDLT